jgi:hypothetical protein
VRRAGLALALLLAGPLANAADDPCLVEVESLAACWARLTGEARTARADAATNAAKKALQAKTTGAEALEGLGSTTSDFLAPFAAALGVAPTTTESGDVAFERSFSLPTGGAPQKVKVQALLRRPTVYEPLRNLLPEATRETRAAELAKGLADFDDVRLAAAWNLENGSFGRRFGDDERSLYAAYFEALFRQHDVSPKRQLEVLARAVDRHQPDEANPALGADPRCRDAATNVADVPLVCLSAGLRRDLMDGVVAAAEAVRTRELRLRDAFAAGGLHLFVDLLSNQPQLSLEASADLRDDIVGPDEMGAKVRYEVGFSNLNGLRRHCRKRRLAETDTACLRSYVDAPGVKESLERGDRFFLSAEFKKRRDYGVALPDDAVTLSLPGTWDFVGGFGLGRYVVRGDQEGRLDLTGEWIYHRDDPNRQNRFVASASYTQRITDTLSLAAGVNYSSRPEFLGDVDKKLGAKFGLRYKLVD